MLHSNLDKIKVTDLDFEETDAITVTLIHYTKNGKIDEYIQLHEGDICIVTNRFMTDRASLGDYMKKRMRDCTGEEMLEELLHHLHFEDQKDEIMKDVVNVIPCMMPYIISMFQPLAMTDRPQVVPAGSTNFAMISQYVELKDDMVFTEEFSVRAARTAVYQLLDINKEICPVTAFNQQKEVKRNAVKTAFRKKVK